uniref:Retrovirus-related Pol polyprotein from transposon TNT 1-94 n=1 Tax=Tanacetum cinerariifolium TaxID=118510 RepID=A0A699J1X7_TANCI|nr:hypothetical protein [Tanacetum cinerariifolium]
MFEAITIKTTLHKKLSINQECQVIRSKDRVLDIGGVQGFKTSTLGEIVSLKKSNKNVNGLHPTSQSQFSICNRLNGVIGLGDDPIACLNKAMAFLTAVASSRFPLTNNKLRTSLNPRNHATIQDGRPKRPKNAAWYKEQAMLAEAQEARQILDEEQLAFLADLGVSDGQAVQTIISNNDAFQTEDFDTYDSDCDDISNAHAVSYGQHFQL